MIALVLLLFSCSGREPATFADRATDLDGDGWTVELGDCDDSDALVHPDADELCDGIDNNCDRQIDEASAIDAPSWFLDDDGDGWGGEETVSACQQPAGTAEQGGDCDDDDALVYPGAEEIPCNGILESCSGPDGGRQVPAQYPTLQEAINAAVPGDWICLEAGDHAAALVDRSLTITGLRRASETRILGDGGPALSVERVQGLTVQALTLSEGQGLSGGGLFVESSSELLFEDVIFSDNLAEQGGGAAFLNSEEITLRACAFTRNDARSGGGLTLWNSTEVRVEDCDFLGNDAEESGGGINLGSDSSLTMQGGSLASGQANEGGGLKMSGGTVLLDSVSISDNVATLGGGIYQDGGSLESTGVVFSGNLPDDHHVEAE